MAKKFAFRLEKILNLRSQKVEELKEDLNRVLAVRFKKQADIIAKENYLKQLLIAVKGKLKAEEVQTKYYHIDSTELEIKKMNNELLQILEIENLKREKLVEAMKEEKILLKLKDRKKEMHTEAVRKEEVILLDEIAQNRYLKSDSILRDELAVK